MSLPAASPALDSDPLLNLTLITTETQLLLACARAAPDAAQQERIRRLAGPGVDWQRVVALADRHSLTSLLCTNLQRAGVNTLPADMPAILRERSWARARANLRLTATLLRLLDKFDEAGIETIALKGPLLAMQLYGDVGQREFIDLDVMVHKRDLRAAWELLEQEGYRPAIRFDGAHHDQLLRYDCECAFSSPDGTYAVDLHWHIAPRYFGFKATPDELWQHRTYTDLGGRRVRTFSAGFLLLVLTVHAAKHGWQQLNGLCDIAELVRQNTGIDWDSLWHDATRFGVRSFVAISLYMAQALMDAPVPASGVLDPRIRLLAQRAMSTMERDAAPGELQDHRQLLQAKDCPQDQLRYAWGAAIYPTCAEWSRWRLPAGVGCLYYPLRAGRLVCKHLLMRGKRNF